MPSKRGRIIDSKKQALYDAEMAVPQGARLEENAEVQAYIDRLLQRDYLQRHYDCSPITVGPVTGHRCAMAYPPRSRVVFPKWSRCEKYVLHEVAHVLAWRRYHRGTERSATYAGHDWRFVATELDLVRNVMGAAVEKAFRAKCKEKKVRFRAKRPVTDAQRAAWGKALEKAAAKLKENQTDA